MSCRSCRTAAAAGLGLLLIALTGCPYGFSSSLLPGHIKSVSVSLFENRSDRGELPTALADSLTEAFIDNHTLKVVGEKSADSQLEGTIVEYRRTPFTVGADEQVLEYRVEIILEVRFVDLRKNKILWEEERLGQWDTYSFVNGESEQLGIGRVLEKLVEDVLNRTVEGW
jgi:Lipopolysaccharide-assembly